MEKESSREQIIETLRKSGAEIMVNYLPVGSEEATRFYAACALGTLAMAQGRHADAVHELERLRALYGDLGIGEPNLLPWLGDLDHKLLWPDFGAVWGSPGPGGTVEPFRTMGPFPIPTINTALLLTSGVTLTISHHALRAGHRAKTAFWLAATILLGATFMGFQAYEYAHAYHELNLKLTSGIYGSTFFMLTGFHGFHVTLGAIMLSVMLYRVMKGHFTPEHHFGFEGAAWYWHFVDVVWLGLYVVVYWL